MALKPIACADGYSRVNIYSTDRGRKMTAVHRLVAEVWVDNPDGLPEVNHIDGQKRHNAATNLEWVTRAANIRHAVATGLHRAVGHHQHANASSVAALRRQGWTLARIADRLGCCVATAHKYALWSDGGEAMQ